MPIGRQPRGVPPHLRSGAAARVPGCDGAETAKRSYPTSEVRGGSRKELHRPRPGAAAGRSYPTSKARGSGQKEQLHVQGVVAVQAQEG